MRLFRILSRSEFLVLLLKEVAKLNSFEVMRENSKQTASARKMTKFILTIGFLQA
jgi:hypothetical protein